MRGTRDRAVYRRPLRAWSFSEGKVVAKAKNEALLCAIRTRPCQNVADVQRVGVRREIDRDMTN